MDAVIFDMDGVIVDSEQYWDEFAQSLYQEATEGEVDVSEEFEAALGMNYREIYDMLADNHPMAMEKDEFIQRYDEASRDIYGEKAELMDGFQELVSAISRNGCTVAIVSSSPRQWMDRVVDRFGIDGIDLLISADTLTQEGTIEEGKPAPDVFLVAADRLNVEPEKCVVVEDSPNGMKAAKRAGMYCIGYRNGSPDADETVDGPSELRETLLGLMEGKGF